MYPILGVYQHSPRIAFRIYFIRCAMLHQVFTFFLCDTQYSFAEALCAPWIGPSAFPNRYSCIYRQYISTYNMRSVRAPLSALLRQSQRGQSFIGTGRAMLQILKSRFSGRLVISSSPGFVHHFNLPRYFQYKPIVQALRRNNSPSRGVPLQKTSGNPEQQVNLLFCFCILRTSTSRIWTGEVTHLLILIILYNSSLNSTTAIYQKHRQRTKECVTYTEMYVISGHVVLVLVNSN